MPVHRVVLLLICLGFVAVAGCAPKATIRHLPDPVLNDTDMFKTTKPLKLGSVVVRVPRGSNVGSLAKGALCIPFRENTWRGGRVKVDNSEFTQTFRDEMIAAGYNMVGDPDNLFEDPEAAKARYQIGGLITELKANVCYPEYTWWTMDESKGESSVTVKWQVYSVLDGKVVAVIETTGTGKVESAEQLGGENAIFKAFAKAVRFLAADPKFIKLLDPDQPVAFAGEAADVSSGTLTPLVLPIKSASTVPLAKVEDSVVIVFMGNSGHGSGFFITDDGYMLTNFHVVKEAEEVRIRTRSRKEYVGKVVRRDRVSDVALVKFDNVDVKALPMNLQNPSVSEAVYAVGAPLDFTELGWTLTAGVVSAHRTEEGTGRPKMQADITVHGGNSGGPLVNKQGQVVGICSYGRLDQQGVMAGLNFFIPPADALKQLHVVIKKK